MAEVGLRWEKKQHLCALPTTNIRIYVRLLERNCKRNINTDK
jgi:hypothetical protein